MSAYLFWPFLEGTLFGFGRSEIVAEPTFLYQDKYGNIGESNRAIVIVPGLVFRIHETPDILYGFDLIKVPIFRRSWTKRRFAMRGTI